MTEDAGKVFQKLIDAVAKEAYREGRNDVWERAIEMAMEHVRLSASDFFDRHGTSLLENALGYARNDDERGKLKPRA